VAAPQTNVPVETATSHQREARHTAQAVEDIARQFSLRLSEVEEILKIHIYRLDQRARIKQYVSLLAIKQVKDFLRTNQRTEHQFSNRHREIA
jgi:Protein of unknown function (DUF3562)